MGRVTYLCIILLIVLFPVALAKGSSSYRSTQPVLANCEEKVSLQERIQCRLEQGSSTDTPETCRDLQVQEECTAFYNTTAPCYDLSDAQKDLCFLEKSGFNTDPERRRWYITALLYELQEYVEDDYDDGILSAEDASLRITKLIQMKRHVLSGTPLSTVRSLFENYKILREGDG